MWGDKQFRQQFRVIDKTRCAYAMNASQISVLVVKKWKKDVFK